jgi:ATP-dependent Clp protease ATP-binding subunit ClpA
VEHILYAVLHDDLGADVLRNCGGNIANIKKALTEYFMIHTPLRSEQLQRSASKDNLYPEPTVGFQRVIQTALAHVQSSGKEEADAGDILSAIFFEEDSHAVYILHHEGIQRLDVLEYISHGMAKKYSKRHEQDAPYKEKEKSSDNRLGYILSILLRRLSEKIDPLIGRKAELARMIGPLQKAQKQCDSCG